MIYFILKGEQLSEIKWKKVYFSNGKIVTYMIGEVKKIQKIRAGNVRYIFNSNIIEKKAKYL